MSTEATAPRTAPSQPVERLWAGDPLARLVIGRLALKPFQFAALAVILHLLSTLVLAVSLRLKVGRVAAAYVIAPHAAERQGAAVWFTLVFSLVLTPAVWCGYLWICRASDRVFRRLIHRGILSRDHGGQEQYLRLLRSGGAVHGAVTHPLWTVMSVLICLGTALLVGAGRSGPIADAVCRGSADTGCTATRLFVYHNLPVWMAGWYMVCQTVARLLSTIYGLWRLFAGRRLNVQPLHPDRVGGLGPLNDYAVRMSYLIGTYGVAVVTLALLQTTFSRKTSLTGYGVAAAFLFLAPVVFFTTIGTAHRAMRLARDRLLARISKRFMLDYAGLQQALAEDDVGRLRARVAELDELYHATARFPVWPFDMESLRRFLLTLAGPVVPLILHWLGRSLKGWAPGLAP